MIIPSYPQEGFPVSAQWGRQVVDALRSLRVRAGRGLRKVAEDSSGTVLEATAQTGRPATPEEDITKVTWWTYKTGTMQVQVIQGKLVFKGVALNIVGWPADGIVNLSDDATTWAWLVCVLSAATATWTTGVDDPGDGDDDSEVVRVFKAVTESGAITEILICQDVRLPGNA